MLTSKEDFHSIGRDDEIQKCLYDMDLTAIEKEAGTTMVENLNKVPKAIFRYIEKDQSDNNLAIKNVQMIADECDIPACKIGFEYGFKNFYVEALNNKGREYLKAFAKNKDNINSLVLTEKEFINFHYYIRYYDIDKNADKMNDKVREMMADSIDKLSDPKIYDKNKEKKLLQKVLDRHREYGPFICALDLDFILNTLDSCDTKMLNAIIELKRKEALKNKKNLDFSNNYNYITLKNLCNKCHYPLFMVAYSDKYNDWQIYAINKNAQNIVKDVSENIKMENGVLIESCMSSDDFKKRMDSIIDYMNDRDLDRSANKTLKIETRKIS